MRAAGPGERPPAALGLPAEGARVQGGPEVRRDSADPGRGAAGRSLPGGAADPGGTECRALDLVPALS